ncbi:1-acyl-sn-glycerol-3-phosphate acyltransferase epsilon-like [Homarus americanus]|uniref:1-acyl-sn-glycerol-3-phosphate acyltransferase epsilon-like n=1 Tax=Homarus americanus TaxID=6706 RepID=UPI001C483B25|nr:1-acyl-sn-glycerol-3-phosphate acyltransferase epsilon-like [Homarus americanus]
MSLDWLVADMVSIRGGALGHLRYVMKDTLQLIPLYGHYFYTHGCIYVKRGNFNQDKMIRSLDYLRDPKITVSVVWYRFTEVFVYYPATPKVIEKSEKFARDNNLKVLRHHLVPKVKGTWLVAQHLHDKFDAVYDVSVFYEGCVSPDGVRGNAPQLIEFLLGKCKKVHIHIRRIPMTEIPKEEEALKVWLHDLYIEKDELAENFFTKDSEKRASVQKRLGGCVSHLSPWSTLCSFLFFSAVTVPIICTSIGRQVYLYLLIYGTLGSYGWLAIRSVC